MTRIHNEGHLPYQRGVAQAGTNCVHSALEGTERGTGIRRQLPVVVTHDAEHDTWRDLAPDRPFEMKLVAALVVGRGILEIECNSCRAIELELSGLVGPGNRHAGIDTRAVEPEDRGEARLVTERGSNGRQIGRMGELAVLPSQLGPGSDVGQPAAVDLS